MSIEYVLGVLTLLVCGVLLLRLAAGARRRQRVDRAAARVARGVAGLWRRPLQRRAAAREAKAAIRRARDGVTREGKVLRPKSFRDKRKLH